MRLKHKISYLSLGILAFVSIAITVAAVVTIDQLLRELSETNMRVEMTRIKDEFERIHHGLQDGDREDTGVLPESARRILSDFFRTYPQQGMLMIRSENGQFLYPEEAAFQLEDLFARLSPETGAGMVRMVYDKTPYLFFSDSFKPWKWRIILATNETELLWRRDRFLKSVVLILLAGLLVGGFLSFVIAKSIASPLVRLAEETKYFDPAMAGKKLPCLSTADEVEELTQAFNNMTGRLKNAYETVEAKTTGLEKANERLTREVSQRKEAQLELATLNDELELLVIFRTRLLEQKAAELEEANLKLLRQDALKSAFLSSISHEFRTPLTSILGFVKLIRRDYHKIFRNADAMVADSSDKVVRIRNNLDVIQEESERLSRLINDFLDFSKIEAGRLDWHDQDVDILSGILQTVNVVEGVIEDKNVALKLHLPEALPLVRIDPDRFKQLLINLISNALKYTDSGWVRIAACDHEDTLQIHVADSGCGVPREELVMVFEKFHQVQGRDTLPPKPKGTGLGLSICLQIVEHYGGMIWMESEVDKGSTVYLELPLVS